jgi:hypothetical protein
LNAKARVASLAANASLAGRVSRVSECTAQFAKIIERNFAIRFAKRRQFGGDPGMERKQLAAREAE